jgi:hypothetical protein
MIKLGKNGHFSIFKKLSKMFKGELAGRTINEKTILRRPLDIKSDQLKKIQTNPIDVNMNQIKAIISSEIYLKGPMPIDEYMKTCLYDKKFGYYTTKEFIFGNEGDFVTSPEISSLFGERIGVFIANALESAFKLPKEYEILETGAGRGFMMLDVITTLITCGMGKGLNAVIVEKSDKLIKIQQENIINSLNKRKIFTDYQYDKVR